MRIYPSKNSNIYDKFFGQPNNQGANQPASSFGQNQGSQNQISSASNGGTSTSRVSNKVLHRLLYSDELASYPNNTLIRKFSKTFSKYQVLNQMTPASESIAAQEKTPAPSSIALREQQSSNQSINGMSGAAGDFDDRANDQSTPLKEVSTHAGGQASQQSGQHGVKRSNQKFNRAANMMAQSSSTVQKPGGSVNSIGVGGNGALGK